MKILLLHIGAALDENYNIEANDLKEKPPFGLLSIYAYLVENAYDAELFNVSFWNKEKIVDLVESKKPDVVGVTCYSFNRFSVFELAGLVKTVDANIKVLLGGPHASHLYEQILHSYSQIDLIVIGEGEITFRSLIDVMLEGGRLSAIRGIAFRDKQGKIHDTGRSDNIANLDQLPFPARYQKLTYSMVFTSRGCPGSCVFCCTPRLWGKKIRFRSVKNVVDEMEMIQNQGNSRINVLDDTFTVERMRVIDICQEIINRGLNFYWTCNSRVNFIDEEMVFWMKKAGCFKINFGVESGSPQILSNLNKHTSVDLVRNASSIVRKYGVQLRFFLIVGSPGESQDSVDQTMWLIEECKPNEILVYEMSYSPGTALYEADINSSKITEGMWLTDNREEIFYIQDGLSPEKIKEYKDAIVAFFTTNEKSYQYSIDDRRNVVTRLPECTLARHELAVSYLKNDKIEEALSELELALDLNGNKYEIFIDYAIAYKRLDKTDLAKSYLLKAQTICPNPIIKDERLFELKHLFE